MAAHSSPSKPPLQKEEKVLERELRRKVEGMVRVGKK
jgi:hypothetical protein